MTVSQTQHAFSCPTTPDSSHFFCQPPRPIVSDASFPSIITSPTILRPFKWQVERAPMHRYRFTSSRLITREAATSEHCVESPRHTGEESALYLATHPPPPPPPTPPQPSHPQPKQSLGGPLTTMQGWGKRGLRDEGERSGDADEPHMPSHWLTLFV